MFVKSPERGLVKSRLAVSLGEEVALDLYKCFVGDLLGMFKRCGYSLNIFFYPPEARQGIVQWLGDKHILFPQMGDNLGERMKNAFQAVFSQGLSAAILIGSDSPDLPREVIDEALTSLKNHESVLGPSYDGGYYLIGLRADTFSPKVFDGIPWSTPDVFKQTLSTLKEANLRVNILPKWRDIDTYDDLRTLFSTSLNTPFAESATIKYMRTAAGCCLNARNVDRNRF
jgi:rSAM/selenodomain-associated transferase 1